MGHHMELELLATLISEIVPTPSSHDFNRYPPLFSFEGLPGAGKSTQIKRVASAFAHKYGKAFFIDLPSQSGIAKVLKSLYSDQSRWHEVRKTLPWLNPLLISLDLHIMLSRAYDENAHYALMSRGILSTYYYNLDAFQEENDIDFESAWDKLSVLLKVFVKPKAIIFLDIPIETAYERVVKRNRHPIRKMDSKENMFADLDRINSYLRRLDQSIQIYHVAANQSENKVTEDIGKILSNYMGETVFND